MASCVDECLRDEDPDGRFDDLITRHGWSAVRDELMAILEDATRTVDEWIAAASALYCAGIERREVNADRLIALLYVRLPNDRDSAESNLAWSITAKLRGLDYLASYDPLTDARVQAHLASIAKSAG